MEGMASFLGSPGLDVGDGITPGEPPAQMGGWHHSRGALLSAPPAGTLRCHNVIPALVVGSPVLPLGFKLTLFSVALLIPPVFPGR